MAGIQASSMKKRNETANLKTLSWKTYPRITRIFTPGRSERLSEIKVLPSARPRLKQDKKKKRGRPRVGVCSPRLRKIGLETLRSPVAARRSSGLLDPISSRFASASDLEWLCPLLPRSFARRWNGSPSLLSFSALGVITGSGAAGRSLRSASSRAYCLSPASVHPMSLSCAHPRRP